MVKWGDFVGWIFFGLLSYFAYDMNSTMKDVSISVAELNQSVAVVLVQQATSKEALDEVKKRVEKIEDRIRP